jgi:hypothetical protein
VPLNQGPGRLATNLPKGSQCAAKEKAASDATQWLTERHGRDLDGARGHADLSSLLPSDLASQSKRGTDSVTSNDYGMVGSHSLATIRVSGPQKRRSGVAPHRAYPALRACRMASEHSLGGRGPLH